MWIATLLLQAVWTLVGPAPLALAGEGKPVSEAELSDRLAFYRGIRDLQVTFKQSKWIKDMDLKLQSEGSLKLHRPNSVVWEITRPSHLLVKLESRRIHIESGEGSNRSVQDFKEGDLPDDRAAQALGGLVAWLNLDAAQLYQQYRIYGIAPRAFRFEPKAKSVFKDLEMKIAPDGHLEKMSIDEASQDRIEIDFAKPTVTH